MPATPEQLKARWETEDGKRRLAELIMAARVRLDWAFILVGFPHSDEVALGRDLRRAPLAGTDLRMARLDWADVSGADFRRANLSGANLSEADSSEADFGGAILKVANLVGTHLSKAKLSGANLNRARLYYADISKAELLGADLFHADLLSADLTGADLKDANLLAAQLTRAKFDDAILTGVKLYGTAHDDWSIKGVKCDYVYWDAKGERRSPPDRNLEPGEFERLYAALPTIEYIFEHGMTPMDLVVMDRVVQAIRNEEPEFDIKIAAVNARGLAPAIKFTVQHEEQKEPALAAIRHEYDGKIAELQSQMKGIYGMLAEKIDSPTKVNIIKALPGSYVAVDGSTIDLSQHIHHVEDIRRAVEKAPPATFGKIAKDTALDIVGGALKDIAKGRVKDAAKAIVDLGVELGPAVLNTSAYSFFTHWFAG